ncbi:MAG: helix-hairpin-helix domain-containing protein [Maribacter sp.]|nr:helix-hairpin-helix domain-containing protein [Maribacter sp.]
MKTNKSHFKFSKQEQRGIFFLLLIIVSVQLVFLIAKNSKSHPIEDSVTIDTELQNQIDSLKQEALKKDSVKNYPFNPNFITDYKGYILGMSLNEIDRLHTFRAQDKFVNSAKEFQRITQVSDSLLQIISPSFKFPEWTQRANRPIAKGNDIRGRPANHEAQVKSEIKDLNLVTAKELKSVNGIGDKLSQRIIKFRDRLGGFLVDEQLNDVYGLRPEVVQKTLKKFKVLKKPNLDKININKATAQEIAKLIYIKYSVADQIVRYREINGVFSTFEELTKIEDFPIDKINRIKLYLTL